MKKALFALLLLLGTLSVSARDKNKQNSGVEDRSRLSMSLTRKDTAKVNPNGKWFFGADAGIQYYLGDHNRQARVGDIISPRLNAYAGHWFTKVFGVRLAYNGLYCKGLTNPQHSGNNPYSTGEPYEHVKNGDYLEKQKYGYFDLHADLMLNLAKLSYGGQSSSNFTMDIVPYVGIGWAHVVEKVTQDCLAPNFGIYYGWRINPHVSIILDTHATLVNDAFDGDPGGRGREGIIGISAGVNYHF